MGIIGEGFGEGVFGVTANVVSELKTPLPLARSRFRKKIKIGSIAQGILKAILKKLFFQKQLRNRDRLVKE